MMSWLRARSNNTRKARELYGAVVAQARRPAFYRDFGVPDTMAGRYEMLALVTFQLLERLRAEGASVTDMSRLTLENLFTDVDDNMREIGIGDLSVPKNVKRAAAGFYERAQAYRPLLEAGDGTGLALALARFMQQREAADAGMRALAAHLLAERRAMAATGIDAVLAGRGFTEPMSGTASNTGSNRAAEEGR
jgi:cytochrome b pre-mRNA-processing protein 3